MKKGLFLLALLLITISAAAQHIKYSEATLTPLLCKAWAMDFATMDGTPMTQKPGGTNTEFDFNEDGTYSLLGNDGSTSKGNWKFFEDKKYIDLAIQGRVSARIMSIEKDKIIMTLVAPTKAPKGVPQVEIHFKPLKK